MSKRKVEIVIIGAGTAGLTARSEVAKVTNNYLVLDEGALGTTCARVGCMPSKVLIQVANDYQRRNIFTDIGIEGVNALTINHKRVMQHVKRLRDRFVTSVLSGMSDWQDDHLIAKRAIFIDQHTLDIEGEQISADKIIIATGSTPVIPSDWKAVQPYLIDTDQLFELDDLPSTMAVIGLGSIGIELGQALHRLGVNVIAIGRDRSIGATSDPVLKDYLVAQFTQEMQIDFSGVESLSERNGKLLVSTPSDLYEVDMALVAVGRKPNIEQLGLDNLGLELNENGLPEFDIHTLQIKDTALFIAGDTNGYRPLLHESADEGAVAGLNAVTPAGASFHRRTPLSITFCSPNIAIIGQSYQQLKERSVNFAIGEASFEGQGRAIVMLKEQGLLRIYGCRDTNKILGAELFAPAGEHLAHLIASWISTAMTVEDCLSLPIYHPVIEEGLRSALRELASQLPEKRSALELATCTDHPTNACLGKSKA